MSLAVFVSQVTLLIAFICVRSSLWIDYSAFSYFEVVTICDLIMILAFYLVQLFRFYRVLTCISWPLSVRARDLARSSACTSLGIGQGIGAQESPLHLLVHILNCPLLLQP